MVHQIKDELITICIEICNQNKSIDEWRGVESSDMFQSEHYNGGFDAIEDEFCFSVYIDDVEYWFQISIEEVNMIAIGAKKELIIGKTEL